jgi:hypothetical protein
MGIYSDIIRASWGTTFQEYENDDEPVGLGIWEDRLTEQA